MTEDQVKKEIERISNRYGCRPLWGFNNGTYNFKFIDETTGKVKAQAEGATMLEAKISCIQMIKVTE
jgi:hypothetical protein